MHVALGRWDFLLFLTEATAFLRNSLCRGKRLGCRDHRFDLWIFVSCNLRRTSVEFPLHLIIPHVGSFQEGCQSILSTISQFCDIFTRALEKGCRTSGHHFCWSGMKFWTHLCYGKSAPLWDFLNAAQNCVFHTSTASLLRYIRQNISEAAVGFCLQGNSVCNPKPILEVSSAQHWGLASVIGPDESHTQVFPFLEA